MWSACFAVSLAFYRLSTKDIDLLSVINASVSAPLFTFRAKHWDRIVYVPRITAIQLSLSQLPRYISQTCCRVHAPSRQITHTPSISVREPILLRAHLLRYFKSFARYIANEASSNDAATIPRKSRATRDANVSSSFVFQALAVFVHGGAVRTFHENCCWWNWRNNYSFLCVTLARVNWDAWHVSRRADFTVLSIRAIECWIIYRV